MKRNSLKSGSLVVSFGIGLCTVFGLSIADADETVLRENAAVKGQIVTLQENDIGYDEERLKRRLGVKSLRGADL